VGSHEDAEQIVEYFGIVHGEPRRTAGMVRASPNRGLVRD
jgi:hypothetical protein